jgi:transcription initiation factor TFIIIB Brf1 subunit/transcription initiation factor TFIIB
MRKRKHAVWFQEITHHAKKSKLEEEKGISPPPPGCPHLDTSIEEEGSKVCIHCGHIVVLSAIDHTAEWKMYTDSQDIVRCGIPIHPLLVQSSYACRVHCSPLDRKCTHEMRIIAKYTEWQGSVHSEKVLMDGFTMIDTLADLSGIAKRLSNDAKVFYKVICDEKQFRGTYTDLFKSMAALFIACRVNNVARSPQEFAGVCHLDKNRMSSACADATEIVAAHITAHNLPCRMDPVRPEHFMDRFSTRLLLDPSHQQLCLFLLHMLRASQTSLAFQPQAIAASVAWYVAKECHQTQITCQQVSMVSFVSEATISKCVKELKRLLRIPSIFKEKKDGGS